MARRPAYNSKAEIKARAERREELFRQLGGFGEAADEFVPTVFAWIQLQRGLQEYLSVFGRPYDRHSTNANTPEARLAAIREHGRMAHAYHYAARMADTLTRGLFEAGTDAAFSAMIHASILAPYPDEETGGAPSATPTAP